MVLVLSFWSGLVAVKTRDLSLALCTGTTTLLVCDDEKVVLRMMRTTFSARDK